MSDSDVQRVLKELEDSVKKHAVYLRKCRSIPKKVDNDEVRERVLRLIRRLIMYSRRIERMLSDLELNVTENRALLSKDVSESLDLLSFFISTVSVSEELKFWRSIDRDLLEELGLDVDKQLERVLSIERKAQNIINTIKGG